MCHSHFHITFNPRINFISGLNGSGKSAIQTALVVGFGGRANVTSRGSSVKSLIKFGCSSASVSITIANGGHYYEIQPFRPEVYGKQITIVRQISETSSTPYKFLDENGRIVKGNKNELKKMMLHFNILVENPICIMNQGMVKIFHKNANPQTKYNLFYKAISADFFNERIEETKLIGKEHSDKLENSKDVLEQCFKEVSDHETYERKTKQLQRLKNSLFQFQNEYAWQLVKKHEKMYKDYISEIEILESDLTQNSGNAEMLNENIKIYNEKLVKKKNELANIEESRSRNHFTYMDLMKQLQNKTNERDAAINNAKKYDNALKMLINDKKDFEKHMEIERQKGNTNTLAQYKEKLVRYEKHISEVEAAWKTNLEHEQTLRNTVDDLLQKVGNLKNNEVTPLQIKISELNRNIRSISQQEDKIHFYGNWMAQLVQTIDNAFKQNQFVKKPIGPIGAYIKVNNSKWIFSIENHLGRGNLRTFLVDNFADNKVLQSIMEKVIPKNTRKPTVITSKFVDRVHNISSKETSNSMFRMLTFANPVVANCLIDNNRIETIMLVNSTLEATPLMENASQVPRNCNFCLTLDGTQVYPNPSYRVYSLQNPCEPVLLQSDVSLAVNNLKSEKQELELKIQNLNKEFRDLEKSKLEKQEHLKKTQSETKLLKTKLDEYTKTINSLRAKCEEEQDDRVASITEEINELNSKIANITKTQEDILRPIDSYESEINEIDEKIKNIKEIIDKTDRSSLMEEIENLQAQINSCKTQLSETEDNLNDKKSKLKDLIKKCELKKKLLEKDAKEAENLCERIDETRNEEVIQKDIKEFTHRTTLLEEELKMRKDDYLVLRDEYLKKKEEFINHSKLYQKIYDIYKNNEKVVERSTTALKEYIDNVKLLVIESFDLVLSLRKIKGQLTINPIEESLVISMFDDISTSCASGGERTFATVALILALWSNMQIPFYSIDEYDVYMDNVNRIATTQLLLMAIEKRNNQFIFLTPQDISHVKSGPNIKIVKLKEPRS